MASYEISVPESTETELVVACTDHDFAESFPNHRRSVAFHCPDCDLELSVDLNDAVNYRPWDGGC